ncbi:hypothetical protein VP01_225g5 [Puccinia sorghi]|uniref:DUF6589 domain-containing protein n=1 Tax=Puccinia sorghi TaxID=27349 RepID=A0A0L6V914_9BASI|nr:hypothetical protein VP01_225g5 [Puccinia sorghi]
MWEIQGLDTTNTSIISSSQPENLPENMRLMRICKVIQENHLTPKKFLLGFLKNSHPALATRQRLWPATCISQLQTPPQGNHPKGCYQSSKTEITDYFGEEEKETYNEKVVGNMDFLFHFLTLIIPPNATNNLDFEDDVVAEEKDPLEEGGLNFEEISYGKPRSSIVHCYFLIIQFKHIARMICCVIAFGINQRYSINTSITTVWPVISPVICINNMDIEQHVHTQSLPSPDLLNLLGLSELTLGSFHNAIKKAQSFKIEPRMFLPTTESSKLYKHVWKSQIMQVMHQYIARPSNPAEAIRLDPPPVETLSATPPNIKMLKLMDAPENSAEGIGQVLDSILNQTGLNTEEFFGCVVQLMDDLVTCQNFNCIQSLCKLQAFLKAHYGNKQDSTDTGVWWCLDELGVPMAKDFPKNNFSLILKHMEWVHEATILYAETILYFLRCILKTQANCIVGFDETRPRPTMNTTQWNATINKLYNHYFTGKARNQAGKMKNHQFHNILICQEFLTVTKANRTMRAGDIDCLMKIWKIWSLMQAQSLKSLRNYSSYLPWF